MKPVPERPMLPQVVPTSFHGLVSYTTGLGKQLLQTFGEIGFRLNRMVPKDGSEAAAMLTLEAQSADPDDPADGAAVLWLSDGTGAGDDGDLMVKITDSNGTTKTATLADFSAL